MAQARNRNRRRRKRAATAVPRPAPATPAAQRPDARAARRAAAWRIALPAVLFAACFGAYVSNGDFLPGNDQVGNMLASVNLLKRGALSIGPPDAPDAFFWTLQQSDGRPPVHVTVDDWNDAADTAYRQGRLRVASHYYYLAATTRADAYVNTFGLGAALMGVPVYALLDLFVDLEENRRWWWHGGAVTASLLTGVRGGVRVPGGARLRRAAAGVSGGAGVRAGQLRVADQQPGALAAPGQHLLPQPRRLVPGAPPGTNARRRLVRGGVRHGGAVPPGERDGGRVRRSVSAVGQPPPLRRLRARRTASAGGPVRLQQLLVRQPVHVRPERGVEAHRAVEHGVGTSLAELVAGERSGTAGQPGARSGLVLAGAAVRAGQRGGGMEAAALPAADPAAGVGRAVDAGGRRVV